MVDAIPTYIPVPDPTVLTTEQLRRELLNQRDYLEARMQGHVDRIDTLFTEGEKRSQALRVADSLALAAALQAAKEAVGEQNRSNGLAISKSEVAFIEALKQQQALFQTEIKAANDKIGVLTSRLDKGEGSSGAVITAHTENRLNVGQLMTAGGLVLLAVSIVISAVALQHH